MRTLVAFVAFQVGWYACVAWGGWASLALVALLIPLQVVDRRGLGRTLAIAAGLGLVADTVLETAGLLSFSGGPRFFAAVPLWVVALWVNFAATMHGCLISMRGRFGLLALLGLIGGPASYAVAEGLGGVSMTPAGYLAVAIEFAIASPLLLWVATPETERLRAQAEGSAA